jgi:hypothetical protein
MEIIISHIHIIDTERISVVKMEKAVTINTQLFSAVVTSAFRHSKQLQQQNI